MKKIFTGLLCLLILANISAQSNTKSKTSIPKVLKEETLKDKCSGKTMYRVTLKDGSQEKICENSDGQWFVHMVLTKDKGPYTKEEAIRKAYEIDKNGTAASEKLGAAVAGVALAHHAASKPTPKTSINLTKTSTSKSSINLNKK